jgi:hypothetical protein
MERVQEGLLMSLGEKVSDGEMTVEEAARAIVDQDGNLMSMSARTLRRFWAASGIQVDAKMGRPRVRVDDSVRQEIVRIHKEGQMRIGGMFEIMQQDEYRSWKGQSTGNQESI